MPLFVRHKPETLSNHAVANTWWDPKSLPSWLTGNVTSTEFTHCSEARGFVRSRKRCRFPIPMPHSSVREDAARIRGIGRRWQEWRVSRRMCDSTENHFALLRTGEGSDNLTASAAPLLNQSRRSKPSWIMALLWTIFMGFRGPQALDDNLQDAGGYLKAL